MKRTHGYQTLRTSPRRGIVVVLVGFVAASNVLAWDNTQRCKAWEFAQGIPSPLQAAWLKDA